ncbi:MAG: XrtA/PEP-CTERM system TPR-repeat protein PrsT [Kiloniellaceae bacterium]
MVDAEAGERGTMAGERLGPIRQILPAGWFAVLLVLSVLAGSGAGLVPQAQATTFVERAQEYLEEGDLRSANIELKNALQRDPNNAEARFLLGSVLLKLGDAPGAEKELLRAKELNYQSDELDLMLAYARLKMRQFDAVLDSVVPDNPIVSPIERDLYVARGAALLELGRYDEAKAVFDRVLARETDVRALALRARLALTLGDSDSARQDLDSALALGKEEYLLSLVEGQWFYQQRRFDEAIQHFVRAIELDQTQLEPRLALVQSYILQGNLESAEATVKSLKSVQPDNLVIVLHEGIVQFLQGRFAEAKVSADQVLARIRSQPQAEIIAGYSAYQLQQYEQARKYLESHLVRVPKDAMTRMVLGATLLRLGEPEKAYEVVGSEEIEVPEKGEYLSMLARTALASGDNAAALAYLEKLALSAPDNAAIQSRLGSVRMRGGDMEGAIDALKNAVSLAPDALPHYERLFYAYLRQRNLEDALSLSDSVRSKFPDSPSGDVLMGVALVDSGKLSEAEAAFERALEKAPDDISVADNVATILRMQGRVDEARSFMDKALERHPDNVKMLIDYAALETGEEIYDAADEYLQRALAASPENETALLRLARLDELRGNSDAATRKYHDILEKGSGAPAAYLGLARLALAEQDYTAAQDQLGELLQKRPDNIDGLFLQAEAERGLGQVQNALATLERTAVLAPGSADVQFWLARSYLDNNEIPKASAALDRAIELEPENVEARTTAIRLAIQSAETDKAVTLVATAPATVADDVDILNLAGQIAIARGDVGEGLEKLEAARGGLQELRGPTAREISVGMAQAYWASNEPQSAAAVLRDWYQANPEDLQVALLLASSERAIGADDKAETVLRAVIDKESDNWAARNDLAMLLHDGGRNDEALAMAEGARELAGDNPYVLDTLGLIHMARGSEGDALALLEKSNALAPDNREIAFHLAQALAASNETERARQLLDRILTQPGGFGGRQAAEDLRRQLAD